MAAITINHSALGNTMANNIDKALSAKAEKILDKQFNYSRFGVLTRRQFCEKMLELGAIPGMGEVRVTKRNRKKPNLSNWNEYVKHESFVETTVTEYWLSYPDDPDTCAVVTKTEYEYFMSLLAAKENKDDQEYWDNLPDTDKAMINGLFGK